MAWTLAALIAVAVQADDHPNHYWKPGFGPWNYKIGFTTLASKECSSGVGSPLEVAFSDETGEFKGPVNMHQCAYKCAGSARDPSKCAARDKTKDLVDRNGNTVEDVPCFCDGMESTDTETVFSVCADEALCKKLCDASSDCYGIHMSKDNDNRCFLLKSDCQEELLEGELVDSTTYHYIAKMDPESTGGEDSCPMGVAVIAEDLSDMFCAAGLNDQYNPVESSDGGVYSTGCANVEWSADGCGWLVTVPKPPPPAPPPAAEECDSMQCRNKVAEANWIFGFGNDEYDVDICTRTEPWISSGYCTNELWKALCTEECPEVTCAICTAWEADNEPAAAVVTSMLELTVADGSTSCAALRGYNMCEDPVVAAVCQTTCPAEEGRRMSEETKQHLDSMRHAYGTRFKHALDDLEAKLAVSGRRLQGDSRMAIYGSWDPTMRPAHCVDTSVSSSSPPNEELMDTSQTWYDWHSWKMEARDITIALDCPDQEVYETTSGVYCETNNLDINNHMVIEEAPGIDGDLCWKKCLAEGTSATTDPTCAGSDPAFNAYSNALCLNREKCEDYCSQLGPRCRGFEMHKTLPRCYLITAGCMEPIESGEYDQVIKEMDRIRYLTNTGMQCGGGSTRQSKDEELTGMTREQCEAHCSSKLGCSGFNFLGGTCTFYKVPTGKWNSAATVNKHCSSGGMYAGYSITNTLISATDDGTIFVEKSSALGVSESEPWSPPCAPNINGPLLGSEIGRYTRQEATTEECATGQSGVCYVSPGGDYRLVWAYQDAFDESATGMNRKCLGWILQGMGENGLYSSEYMTFSDETCDDNGGAVANPALADAAMMYLYSPEEYPAMIYHVCKSYPTCGALQTCVLAKNRFASELAIQYTKGGVSAYGTPWVSNMPPSDRGTLLDSVTYQPKNLISVEKAVAFVSEAKGKWTYELYRNVPGPLRIRVNKLGAGVSKAIITMASSDAFVPLEDEMSSSMRELGVEYTPPAGYEPWYTDIVRIERFDAAASPVGGGAPATRAQVDFYAPNAPALVVFQYAPDGSLVTPDGVEAEKLPGSPGFYRVTVDANGDYVGTTKKPCLAIPSTDDMVPMMGGCPSVDHGAVCPFTCKPGKVKTGDFVCDKGAWSDEKCRNPYDYKAETQLFRLSHRSRLDYGWRIRSVTAYTSADCSKNSKISGRGKVAIVGSAGSYSADYGIDKADLLATPGAETSCFGGRGGGCKDWWSMGLNVNPYDVDMTHGAATYLDFTVESNEQVKCVQVVSRTLGPGQVPRQYYPSEMTLYRGWKWESGDTIEEGARKAGMTIEDSIIDVDGWTELWTATSELSETPAVGGKSFKDSTGLLTTFSTQCGQVATRIFGELLKEVDGVPSSCHCKQLCIDNIDEGCRSWNYHMDGACYLQSSIKSMPEESCQDYADWIAGDTGLRLTDISPTVVPPGTGFSLTVNGVNLPTESGAKLQGTTPPRQRVKIVPVEDSNGKPTACAEGEIAEHVEGIGCSHPYFCAPRPSATDIDSASWGDLKVHASATDKMYKVCYNRGFTYDRYEWHEVGELSVQADTVTWSTMPAKIMRKTATFDLKIEASSAFGAIDTSLWKTKLIRSYFDCDSVLSDPKFNVTSIADARHSSDLTSATWTGLKVYDEAAESFADVGEYKVCFSDGTGPTFKQIPSGAGDGFLEIEAEADYSEHPRRVYTYQTLSGKAEQENTFTLKGHRLRLPSADKIGLFTGGCAGTGTELNITADVDETASTADGYVFTGTVGVLASGTYDVCYCNAQTDDSLLGAGTTYAVTEDRTCGSTPSAEGTDDGATFLVANLSATTSSHLCTVKCARGCVGQDCYCDAFDQDTMYVADTAAGLVEDKPYALCMSVTMCRDACDAHASCTGFDYDPATNFCWLLRTATAVGACPSGAYSEGRELWFKSTGSACGETADFDSKVGEVTITNRPSIGNNWIVSPGMEASVEVIGTGLEWKTDRIMMIDCTGICGVSGPSGGVEQKMFNHMVAVRPTFEDPPHDDHEGAYTAPAANEEADVFWRESSGHYCPGNNMDITTITTADANRHQCYKKCVTNAPCVGADCNCDGLLQGYDGPDSQALCLTETQCKVVCEKVEGCYGIDMHNGANRCFLNGVEKGAEDAGTCEEYITNGQLTKLGDYDFFYKQRAAERRATEASASPERKLLAAVDMGFSWDEILRFQTGIPETGGQYKVCFCDRDTLSAGQFCKKASDYKIDIGTYHVSGVSCLIADPKFQRGTCVEQYHGGLRCYMGPVPTLTVPLPPTVALIPQNAPAGPTIDDELSAYCLYGPEEETRDDPMCP